MVIPATIIMHNESRTYRMRYGKTKVFLFLASVFCTVSFGTFATLGVILTLIFWDRLAGKWFGLSPRARWGLVAFVAISTLTVLKLTTNNPILMTLMYHLHGHSGAWLYRWQLFERVFAVMDGYWWLGYGEEYPEQFRAGHVGRSIDNCYLVILLGYGQVGVLTWIGVHLAALFANVRECWIKKEIPGTALATGFGIVIVGMLLAQIFVVFFSTALTLNFMVLGFAIGQAQFVATQRKGLAGAVAWSQGNLPGAAGSPRTGPARATAPSRFRPRTFR
jgi:hypothetical protein